MERGSVLSSARQNGLIIKQNRITGNRLRSALAPEYAPNPLSPVVVTTSEQGLLNNWERRFLRTTQTHLLYPSLIFAGQRLLGGHPQQVQVGGASFQAMTAKGGNEKGYLTGNQAAHLNLATAKFGGRNLVRSVSEYLYQTRDAETLAPNLCRLTDAAIALEGDIAVQAAFLNQTDAAMETVLHSQLFGYLTQFSSEIRPDFLLHANQMVLNNSVQAFSGNAITKVAERILKAVKANDGCLRKQHPSCSGSGLFGGSPKDYLEFLLDNDALQVGKGDLFRAASFHFGDVNAASSIIQEEVSAWEQSKAKG